MYILYAYFSYISLTQRKRKEGKGPAPSKKTTLLQIVCTVFRRLWLKWPLDRPLPASVSSIKSIVYQCLYFHTYGWHWKGPKFLYWIMGFSIFSSKTSSAKWLCIFFFSRIWMDMGCCQLVMNFSSVCFTVPISSITVPISSINLLTPVYCMLSLYYITPPHEGMGG